MGQACEKTDGRRPWRSSTPVARSFLSEQSCKKKLLRLRFTHAIAERRRPMKRSLFSLSVDSLSGSRLRTSRQHVSMALKFWLHLKSLMNSFNPIALIVSVGKRSVWDWYTLTHTMTVLCGSGTLFRQSPGPG